MLLVGYGVVGLTVSGVVAAVSVAAVAIILAIGDIVHMRHDNPAGPTGRRHR